MSDAPPPPPSLQLIVAMRGACGAVITFLTRVMKEDAPELSRNQTMFIYSCIRIALAWLAEVGDSREETAAAVGCDRISFEQPNLGHCSLFSRSAVAGKYGRVYNFLSHGHIMTQVVAAP